MRQNEYKIKKEYSHHLKVATTNTTIIRLRRSAVIALQAINRTISKKTTTRRMMGSIITKKSENY
jgi:hypothetical protein